MNESAYYGTGGKNCLQEKTAPGAPSKTHHTTQKKHKKSTDNASMFIQTLCSRCLHIAATTRHTPTKLVGYLTHIPINIPIAAICVILVIFDERGDFYTTASFLMMMNLHSLERHLRLYFYI
jgi:hypothetical protein